MSPRRLLERLRSTHDKEKNNGVDNDPDIQIEKEFETNIVPLEGSPYIQRRYTCPEQTEMAVVKKAVTGTSKGKGVSRQQMMVGKDQSLDKVVDDKSSLSITVEVKVKVSMANQLETPLRHTLSFKTAIAKKVNNLKDPEKAANHSEQPIDFVTKRLDEDCQTGESVAIVQEILSTLLTDVVNQHNSNCITEHFTIAREENIAIDPDRNSEFEPAQLNLKKSDSKQDLGSEKFSQQTALEFVDGAGAQTEIDAEVPVGGIPTAFWLLRDPVATPESQPLPWDERIIFPMEHEVKGVSLWSVGTGGCVGVDYRFPTPTGRESVGRQVRFPPAVAYQQQRYWRGQF